MIKLVYIDKMIQNRLLNHCIEGTIINWNSTMLKTTTTELNTNFKCLMKLPVTNNKYKILLSYDYNCDINVNAYKTLIDHNINLRYFLENSIPIDAINEFKLALKNGIDLSVMLELGNNHDANELKFIRNCLSKNVDTFLIRKYCNNAKDDYKMYEKMLCNGVRNIPTLFTYNTEQKKEISKALIKGIDITKYIDKSTDHKMINIITKLIEIDKLPKNYNKLSITKLKNIYRINK